MQSQYHIQVLSRGEWREYSSTHFTTLDDAAHECLLIMPQLRRNFDGVRINCVMLDVSTQEVINEILYHKSWAKQASAAKPNAAEAAGLRKPRGLVVAAGVSVVAGLLLFYFNRAPTADSQIAPAKPLLSDPQHAERQSYIYHPSRPAPVADKNPQLKAENQEIIDERSRSLAQKKPLADQAQDVVSILDAIDYLNCASRQPVKATLVKEFTIYALATRSPPLETDGALKRIEEQAHRHPGKLPPRDLSLEEIGCSGLFGLADLYGGWFRTHK